MLSCFNMQSLFYFWQVALGKQCTLSAYNDCEKRTAADNSSFCLGKHLPDANYDVCLPSGEKSGTRLPFVPSSLFFFFFVGGVLSYHTIFSHETFTLFSGTVLTNLLVIFQCWWYISTEFWSGIVFHFFPTLPLISARHFEHFLFFQIWSNCRAAQVDIDIDLLLG